MDAGGGGFLYGGAVVCGVFADEEGVDERRERGSFGAVRRTLPITARRASPFIMSPQAYYFDRLFFFKDFVNKAVLTVNSSGV